MRLLCMFDTKWLKLMFTYVKIIIVEPLSFTKVLVSVKPKIPKKNEVMPNIIHVSECQLFSLLEHKCSKNYCHSSGSTVVVVDICYLNLVVTSELNCLLTTLVDVILLWRNNRVTIWQAIWLWRHHENVLQQVWCWGLLWKIILGWQYTQLQSN